MATFDFNDFQKAIFLQVFNNPMQKAPETEATFNFKPTTVEKPQKKAAKQTLGKKEPTEKKSTEKGRGRPKGSLKRKSSDEEYLSIEKENIQKKARKPSLRINSDKNIYQKTYGKRLSEKIIEPQAKIQKTSFEIHQEKSNNNESNTIRRSLRAKPSSIDVLIEIIEKPFEEMNQQEFLHFFRLQKVKS